MIAALFIIGTPVALWSYVFLRLPDVRFEFDINRQQWSFLNLYDRYAVWYRYLSTISLVLGVSCWWVSRETAAYILISASLYALAWQIVTLHFYETYVQSVYTLHRAPGAVVVGPTNYTALRYSFVITLGVAPVLLFLFGLVAALAAGVRAQ
jgi:hypothetical protein